MTTPTSTTPSPSLSASTITESVLDALLHRYDDLITHLSASASIPSKPTTPNLLTLDRLRYIEIPQRLAARKKEAQTSHNPGDGTYLEKEEVEDLVRWKLRHGTFRPRLTQLVASNSAAAIRDTTRAAFALYASSSSSGHAETYMSAIKTLAKLKGVGPATASLLLAVYDPDTVPFFADELYWWVCCEGEWGAGIRYVVGEYKALWEGVRGVRGRLNADGKGVRAVELERGAWVLGWEARGGGGKKGRAPTKGEGKVSMDAVRSKRKIGQGSRDDSTSSPPPPPKAPNRNLTTPAAAAPTEPHRPISPPPKRHPPEPNTESKPTDHRQLRRSKRTKRS